LLDTQRAMLGLPGEGREKGVPARDPPNYGQSLEHLQVAAQKLRESIQGMATQPAGEHRNQAIRQAHDALVETQQTMILAAALATAALPMIIVAPPALAMDVKFANGCWARLYDRENFRGDSLTVVGPVLLANARIGSRFEWGRHYDSVEVGPKATLIVFDNENFRQHTATLKPSDRIADLDAKLTKFENIRSLKLDCAV